MADSRSVEMPWGLSPWQAARVAVIEHKVFVLSCRLKAVVELHQEGEIARAVSAAGDLITDTLTLLANVSDLAATMHATAILTGARPPEGPS